ncbi:hypothetical protein GCM10018965_053200 [Nonomuraea roseola]
MPSPSTMNRANALTMTAARQDKEHPERPERGHLPPGQRGTRLPSGDPPQDEDGDGAGGGGEEEGADDSRW